MDAAFDALRVAIAIGPILIVKVTPRTVRNLSLIQVDLPQVRELDEGLWEFVCELHVLSQGELLQVREIAD